MDKIQEENKKLIEQNEKLIKLLEKTKIKIEAKWYSQAVKAIDEFLDEIKGDE